MVRRAPDKYIFVNFIVEKNFQQIPGLGRKYSLSNIYGM